MNTIDVNPFDAQRARDLTTALSSGLRAARYWDAGNTVMQKACSSLFSQLDPVLAKTGSVEFVVHGRCVFVDGVRVSASVREFGSPAHLVELFETLEVSSITFTGGLTAEELMLVLGVLSQPRSAGSEDLVDMLRTHDVKHVEVRKISADQRQPLAVRAMVLYSAAVQLNADLGGETGPIRAATVRRARRVAQAMVDEILRDPASLLTLTTIKDYDRYLLFHSTNVAILSAILGRRLGLDKRTLGELCLAGFLHDAGKLGVDPCILNKPGALDDEEWAEMRQHPILAVRTLLNAERLTESIMRSAVVAFEHHLNHDASGYPPTKLKKSVTLLGGIVSIADRFDAVTTARVYREVNPTPAEALVGIIAGTGTHFDPVLVKLFVDVMGVYPPGTVVGLSGGETGVVCRPPVIGSALDRPRVRLVSEGSLGAEVDLAELDGDGYARSIVSVINPSNKGQIPAVDPTALASLV